MSNTNRLYLSQASSFKADNGILNKDYATIVTLGNKVIYALAEERLSGVKHDGMCKYLGLDNFRKYYKDLISDLGEPTCLPPKEGNEHHIDHIYDVFYNSGFKESAVLVVDGCGTENDSITLAYMVENEKPVILKKFSKDESIGILYGRTATFCLGGSKYNDPNCDHMNLFLEGKFMGLAPYGNPYDYSYFRFNKDHIDIDRPRYQEDTHKYNNLRSESILYTTRVAATVQRDFENCVVDIVEYLYKLLLKNNIHTDNLCLSGGCILNCPTNSKIVKQGLFKHYYSTSNPGDGGATNIGAVYRSLEKLGIKLESRRLSPFLGYSYTMEDILGDLAFEDNSNNDPEIKYENLIGNTIYIHLLVSGKILAWYQGSSEWGPRALGHRSFLADPSKSDTLVKLNNIKGREIWRPLAPIIPEELFSMVFEDADGNNDMADLMLRTYTIKPEWRSKLRAVCHIDNTTRPQLLKKNVNSKLYKLLMEWYGRTGIPGLVNTSLNIDGKPMMDTPLNNSAIVQNINDKYKGDVIFVVNYDRYFMNLYKK